MGVVGGKDVIKERETMHGEKTGRMRNRKEKGFLTLILLCVLLLAFLVRATEEKESRSYDLCYLNGEENKLLYQPILSQGDRPEDVLQILMGSLNGREKGEDGVPLFPAGVQIQSFSQKEDTLTVDLSREYASLDPAKAFLIRAGVVRTLLQVPGLTALSFSVAGEELKDEEGKPLGKISWGEYLDMGNDGPDAFRFDTLTLYFTDKKGKKLFSETRKVYCRRDVPREYVVLEQLAKGPMTQGHYPTISQNVAVNKVLISNRIAHVDLSRAFLDYPQDISSSLAVASVVHSLIAAGNVDEVQVSVAGDEHVVMSGDVDLYQYFGWNEKLVKE